MIFIFLERKKLLKFALKINNSTLFLVQKTSLEGQIFNTLKGALVKNLNWISYIAKTVKDIKEIPLVLSSVNLATVYVLFEKMAKFVRVHQITIHG